MATSVHGTLRPNGAPVLRREILANSITVTVLDSVKVASGFIALGTAGALVFGHVMGIGTNKGVGLTTTGVVGAELGSYFGTFATASDNQTVAMVRAECDVSKETLMSFTPSAALGTTTGSNLLGYRIDLSDEDTTDEATAHATNTSQYHIWGVDPQVSTNHVISILESGPFGV